jgi:putative ABC transport system permease protein
MGVLVMVTAVHATQARRTLEHTIFKVLGATRRHMLTMLGMEYVCLGLVAAVAASLLGVLAASVLTAQVLNIVFDADYLAVVMTSLLAMTAITVVGVFFAWLHFRVRPIDVLRNE